MATDQSLDVNHLDTVRYPSELLRSLDAFVGDLHRRILADAACSAMERSGHGSAASIVSTDDLLTATRAAIPEALAELEKALECRKSSYARRAS
jgi:hypothetical protein